MKLALLLHIYQPPTQYESVFSKVTEKCYEELIKLLETYPQARITLNVPAALTVQFAEYGYSNIIADLKSLAERGQIEFTGSAAYHPLLFKLPKREIRRQIKLNEAINRKFFGQVWRPFGFFPPELAVDDKVLDVVEDCGYEWILVEEKITEEKGEAKDDHRVFIRSGGTLQIIPRTRNLSLNIAFGKISTLGGLRESIRVNPLQISVNPILAMDGETFGWHQKKQLDLLEQIFAANSVCQSAGFELVTVSELVEALPKGPEIKIEKSSWGERVERNGEVYYPRWEDPDNPIHKLQWKLTELAIDVVNDSEPAQGRTRRVSEGRSEALAKGDETRRVEELGGLGNAQVGELAGFDEGERQWLKARLSLDRALHSDQFFWAAGERVWHPGMVERGARMLRDAVLSLPDADESACKQSRVLYDEIVTTGRELYGSAVKD